MDYIERERRRLEIDLHVLTRRWHGTLSRMFVLRGRLDGIDPTDVEAFSRTANALGAFANDATSLKRDVDKAKRRLASFDVDAQRRANADVEDWIYGFTHAIRESEDADTEYARGRGIAMDCVL